MQPGAERLGLSNGSSLPRQDEENGLSRILCLVRTAKHVETHAVNDRAIPLDERGEGGLRGLARPGEELLQELLVGSDGLDFTVPEQSGITPGADGAARAMRGHPFAAGTIYTLVPLRGVFHFRIPGILFRLGRCIRCGAAGLVDRLLVTRFEISALVRAPRVIRIGEIDPLAGTRVAGPEDLVEQPGAGIAQVFRQQFDVCGAGGMVAPASDRGHSGRPRALGSGCKPGPPGSGPGTPLRVTSS